MKTIHDRLPPHSIEAEQGALGCCLLNPPEAIGICASEITSDSFYDRRHRVIYAAISVMHDNREPIDIITLSQSLRDSGELDAIGGLAYMSALQDSTPSPAHLRYYLEIIKEKHQLRTVLARCSEACAKIYEGGEGTAAEIIEEVESAILKLSTDRKCTDLVPIKTLVRDAIDRVQSYHQAQGSVRGIPTGFVDIDSLLGGLKGGEMVVIAARPSIGKTSLAMNIAEHVGATCGIQTCVFSLEMTKEALVDRLLCASARVSGTAVQKGHITDGDLKKLTGGAAKIGKSSLHIDDTSTKLAQIRARARQLYTRGCRLFIVDYLQLVQPNRLSGSREQDVSGISAGLKGLAKELNCPVVVLAQLNRDIEKDKNRKPRLSDLRESGSVEQDSDVVMMLYRTHPDDDESTEVGVRVAKHRNGQTGDVTLHFLKSYTRFENASKHE